VCSLSFPPSVRGHFLGLQTQHLLFSLLSFHAGLGVVWLLSSLLLDFSPENETPLLPLIATDEPRRRPTKEAKKL